MPSKSAILVVSNSGDAHADDIIDLLKSRQQKVVRLNTDDIPMNTQFVSRIMNGLHQGYIQVNNEVLAFEDIRSVWWRRPDEYKFPEQLSDQEKVFAKNEIEHYLSGLWHNFDCYWISFPEAIKSATWKPHQLVRARQYGFDVPDTLFTNNPGSVSAFFDDTHEQMVYKVLTDPSLAADKVDKPITVTNEKYWVTPTTQIHAQHLERLESVQFSLCQFQALILKQYELRVMVIGEQVFAAELRSQENAITQIDWRFNPFGFPYQKAELPPDIERQCLAFVKSYGLSYSAMDFIVTPDGRYIFLENNPNGQFLFIEAIIPELRLRHALVECLIAGKDL